MVRQFLTRVEVSPASFQRDHQSASPKPRRNGAVTIEDLIAAKKVLSQFGSAEKAIRAIEALKHFS